MQAQTPVTQQDYNFGWVNSFNSTGYVSQLENYKPSYHHPGWGTYDNSSYEYSSKHIHDSSSSYFQEQVMKPSKEELFLALKYEIKKDNEALERQLSNIEPNMEANKETKLDAKIMEDMNTNLTNLGREMGGMLDKIALHVEEITRAIKEQSSRQLLSNLKNDHCRESENATLSLEDELLNPTLKEDKDILDRETIPLML